MNFLLKIHPQWPLRIGIGVMYFYSGFDLMIHPTSWYWALPYWLKQIIIAVIPLNAYLKIQGAAEILMAVVLLAWFLKSTVVKWAALLSTLEMAGILVLAFLPWSAVNFLFTFRDIGVLGGSLALFIILLREEGESSGVP